MNKKNHKINIRIIILFGLSFLLFNCTKQKEKNVEFANNRFVQQKDSTGINKVFIIGTTDDIPAFKVLNIMNNNYLFGRPHLNFDKEIIGDSLHMVLNSIDKPFLSQIVTANKAFYEGYAFLIPGDTLDITINNGKMEFFGKNAVLNNFFSEMKENTPEYKKNPYLGNINLYKERVNDIYKQKLDFFYKYVNDNGIQSKLFLNTYKSFLRHEYLFSLIAIKNNKSTYSNNYIGKADNFISLIQEEVSKNPELIFDVSSYFDKITIKEFKNEAALNNVPYFKNNINPFIRYYFLNSEVLAYTKEKFLQEKEFIQKNFEGEIENYAIARMVRDYHLKGFGKGQDAINLLKSTIKEYKDQFTKPSYIEFMEDVMEDLDSYDFQLSESALNSKLININGDTLNLKTIFSRSNKRIKVIDFWTTWCPPCIKQIAEGKAFKDKLSVKYNVDWVYISPEKNYINWLETNKKYQETLNFYNSFFLPKGKKAALTGFFKVDQFPRYVIINQKNTIVLNNAPSPEDEENFKKIIKGIASSN